MTRSATFTNMPRVLLTYCMCLVWSIGYAKSVSNPYQFQAPDFASLLPFDVHELRTMHEKGVYRIEESHSNGASTVYTLDQRGLVASETSTSTYRGRSSITECIYRYSDSGMLLSKRCTDPITVYLDTIAYDAMDRITYYRSTMTTTKGKKRSRGTMVWWELKYEASDSAHVVLLDSNEYHCRRVSLNNYNEAIRIQWKGGRIDSVYVGTETVGMRHRQYWYRDPDGSYFLGQEFVSSNGKPMTESLWNMIGDGCCLVYRKNYHYDDQGLLCKKENDIKYQQKVLYTYHENGLLMEQVTIHMDRVEVARFKYWY